MKKIITLVWVMCVMFTLVGQTTTFYDTRDSQLYNKVVIGDQEWMAENLNYETDESWCYTGDTAECSTYGRLYHWEQADTICPSGWHLPSDTEWRQFEQYVGMSALESERMGYRQAEKVGEKLKAVTRWASFGNGTDEYYFSILPAGFRVSGGNYYSLGHVALFWSATENGSQAYGRMFYYQNGVDRMLYTKQYGASVRCVKN